MSVPSEKMHASRINICLLGLFIAISMSSAICGAASFDTRGTDFWLAFPNNFRGDIENAYEPSIAITAETNANGNIRMTSMSIDQSFSISSGGVTVIDLDPGVMVDPLITDDAVTQHGMHITSDHDISVYIFNRRVHTTDATIILPTDALGTQYYILSYENWHVNWFSANTQLDVLATEDNTSVTITLPCDAGSHIAYTPFVEILNQGEIYQVDTLGLNKDYTGGEVVSDKPIVVYGTHGGAQVPVGIIAVDHLLEQEPSIDKWGTYYLTMPFATRFNGDPEFHSEVHHLGS